MTPVRPPEQKGASAVLFWWLAPILTLILGLAVWSNHYNAGFHGDDFSTIVNNPAIHSLRNIPRFFWQPRAFSAEPENGDYKPLLLTSFALDASSNPAEPLVYQMDSFVWFTLLMFTIYALFRVVPGTNRLVALLGAAIFGVHPIAAETVNYIVQRGQIMAAFGVSAALVLWIVWPEKLPQRLGIDMNRVPQNWWQDQLRKNGPTWERKYKEFLRLPIPFYLIPLLPALLAEPLAAVFPLLLYAYTRVYRPEDGYSRLKIPAVICGTYWLAQTILVWAYSSLLRPPVLTWWATQPWVAIRYLFRFLFPVNLSADAGLHAMRPWHPLALAGFAGVAGLVFCAKAAGRREELRGVAFGLWWFLICLVPSALVPRQAVEANPRMFFAAAGLAFAVAHLGKLGFEYLQARLGGNAGRIAAWSLSGAAALALLGALSWMTWERNEVWESEKTLWRDVTEKNPENARGYIEYASALLADSDDVESLVYLRKAAALSSDDGLMQLRMAQGFDRMSRDDEAERHFRRAIELAPRVSSVYSYYGQWLYLRQRLKEAFDVSSKGLALNSADLISRHTLMDLYAAKSEWGTVARLARETLALNPDDPEGKRSLVVATASLDQLHQAETDVKSAPTVDDYLKLSVLYYHSQRYEDCVNAAREAVRLRPNLAEGYANMATALHTLGRDDEAIAALREVIRLRPDMEFAKTDLEILLEKKAHQNQK